MKRSTCFSLSNWNMFIQEYSHRWHGNVYTRLSGERRGLVPTFFCLTPTQTKPPALLLSLFTSVPLICFYLRPAVPATMIGVLHPLPARCPTTDSQQQRRKAFPLNRTVDFPPGNFPILPLICSPGFPTNCQ